MTQTVSKIGREELVAEGEAFADTLRERLENGYVPDLRRLRPCEYFIDNIWRDPKYAQLHFGSYAQRLIDTCKAVEPHARVLEVGCGPGFVALELARAGFHVTGIDIYELGIETARQFADENPFTDDFGSLRYELADLEGFSCDEPFDVAVFHGSLHHFPDPSACLDHTLKLLAPEHATIAAVEPAYENVTEAHTLLLLTLQELSAELGGYRFEGCAVEELAERAASVTARLRQVDEDGDKSQSPLDDSCGLEQMRAAIASHFEQTTEEGLAALFPYFVGGLRGDRDTRHRVAEKYRALEQRWITSGVLAPLGYLLVGRGPKGRNGGQR